MNLEFHYTNIYCLDCKPKRKLANGPLGMAELCRVVTEHNARVHNA